MSINIFCDLLSPITKSLASWLWTFIQALWPWHWLWILVVLIGWVVFEILTRNGAAHYNSENGFSPTFNRFVGSGTYLGVQAFLLLLLPKILGAAAYCFPTPYIIHSILFLSTGLLLHLTGFWPYLKEPGGRRRRK